MAETQEPSINAEPVGIMPIRDNTFVRLYADVSLVTNQPQGVEISLFQRSPSFRNVIMSASQPTSVETGLTLVDVARIRIGDEEAASLAYNILLSLAESGITDLNAFDKNLAFVRAIIEKAELTEE